jgi:hypothetical protein
MIPDAIGVMLLIALSAARKAREPHCQRLYLLVAQSWLSIARQDDVTNDFLRVGTWLGPLSLTRLLCRFPCLQDLYHVSNRPKPMGHTCGHCRGDVKRLVDAAKVTMHVVQRETFHPRDAMGLIPLLVVLVLLFGGGGFYGRSVRLLWWGARHHTDNRHCGASVEGLIVHEISSLGPVIGVGLRPSLARRRALCGAVNRPIPI